MEQLGHSADNKLEAEFLAGYLIVIATAVAAGHPNVAVIFPDRLLNRRDCKLIGLKQFNVITVPYLAHSAT